MPPEVDEAAGPAGPPAHLTDLTCPASWYPAARQLRRTVVAHLGPTNSGKTHAALQQLRAAPSGVYCGPLRLLAWEARALPPRMQPASAGHTPGPSCLMLVLAGHVRAQHACVLCPHKPGCGVAGGS